MRGVWFMAVGLAAGMCFGAAAAWAGVHFLVQDGEQYISDQQGTGSAGPAGGNECETYGYRITHCEPGFIPAGSCPYSSRYYKECCPEEYIYTPEECQAQGKMPSTFSCGGLYSCI